jgi:hypothetical protein
MDKQKAKNIIASWNGEDRKFIHDGAVYSHRDVQLLRNRFDL